MKRHILICLGALLCTFPIWAQESGIRFFHGTWSEAVAQAKQEQKQLFVDFYTEWCGPCLHMALTVFPLPQVGEVYNKHFVCLQVDAEKGEGVELARKYGVRSFPSYLFIDPATEKVVHRSGGNKPADDFMADVKGALCPQYSSIYLQETYQSGHYDADFLIDYIRGKKVSGSRDVTADFDRLIGMGCKLTDKKVWNLFVECVRGYDNAYIRQISDQYAHFAALFGKEAVDQKLAEATAFAPASFIRELCDFEGKEYNLRTTTLSQLFREKKYDEAWAGVDRMLADTTVNQRMFVEWLSFYTRVDPQYADPELSYEQLARKVHYTRYVAYNTYNRDDAYPHYYYALALEYLVQRSMKEGKPLPADLFEVPTVGKAAYSMRHPLLKMKPAYRKK